MGFFDFLREPDINQGVAEYRETPGAILLDVREPQEYHYKRIPDSINIPLNSIDTVSSIAKQDTPLFVYCYSGARSSQAVKRLQRMGFSNVKDIGGIASYTGKVES